MNRVIHSSLRPLVLALGVMIIAASVSIGPRVLAWMDKTPPEIDVWYGTHQVFGKPGLAQRWVNVLGNVTDPESQITSLHYRLNGAAPVNARIGPDKRRLAKAGDFNLEIDPASLRVGDNKLVIEATNGIGLKTDTVVTLTYHHSIKPLALPYIVDWKNVYNLQDVAQVVDGEWRWSADGVRPVEKGYDRMIAFGDSRWTNYQVTVPVAVHGVDRAAYDDRNGGNHAGISVDLRWIGHSDNPRKCPPPRCGWNPVGNFNKYWFKPDGADYLGMKIREEETKFPSVPYQFQIGHTYIFKVQVRTTPQGNEYKMKVWEQGVQTEPADWMFTRLAVSDPKKTDNPDHGAFSLVAHYSDVTFGNITVTPVTR